jgi:hypothetical protein
VTLTETLGAFGLLFALGALEYAAGLLAGGAFTLIANLIGG